jgi:hypothetical protein
MTDWNKKENQDWLNSVRSHMNLEEKGYHLLAQLEQLEADGVKLPFGSYEVAREHLKQLISLITQKEEEND